MNVNGRYIQELLNLQLMREFDITASSLQSSQSAASSSSSDESGFNALLQQMLGQAAVSVDMEPEASSVSAPAFHAAQAAPANYAYYVNQSGSYDSIIRQASVRYGVDASLIKAVVHAESAYNASAVSGAGAKGLMQLMDNTARGLGITDSFDPIQNIDGGTRFMKGLLDKYNGNKGVALAAYNAGPGRVDRLGITNDAELAAKSYLLPRETQRYVEKVLGLQNHYQS